DGLRSPGGGDSWAEAAALRDRLLRRARNLPSGGRDRRENAPGERQERSGVREPPRRRRLPRRRRSVAGGLRQRAQPGIGIRCRLCNSRGATVTELVRDSLDHCVKCTICETFCPYSQATPLFPGPKYVGPQAERYRGAGASVDASVDYCSGCGICTQVCPQGVRIAEINSRARAALWEERGIPLRNQVIGRPSVIGRLGTPVAPVANWA